MYKGILKKYKKEFQFEMFKQVDDLFPKSKSKERDRALLLITVLGVKFSNLLEVVAKELK